VPWVQSTPASGGLAVQDVYYLTGGVGWMTRNRNLLYLTMYVVLFFTGLIIWYFFLNPFLRSNFFGNDKLLFELLWVSGKTLIWIIPVFIYLRYVDSVNSLEYLKFKCNLKKGIKWGVLLGIAFIAIELIKYNVTGTKVNFHMDVYYWIAGVLVGFFEEIPFRGFLQQKIESMTNFWTANVITNVIFLLHHFPKWIQSRYDMILVNGIFVIFLGLIFGFVFKKTKSLWSVVIFHSLADLILFMAL
jgi:membrane protease YdiL (CAAX protease family)